MYLLMSLLEKLPMFLLMNSFLFSHKVEIYLTVEKFMPVISPGSYIFGHNDL